MKEIIKFVMKFIKENLWQIILLYSSVHILAKDRTGELIMGTIMMLLAIIMMFFINSGN